MLSRRAARHHRALPLRTLLLQAAVSLVLAFDFTCGAAYSVTRPVACLGRRAGVGPLGPHWSQASTTAGFINGHNQGRGGCLTTGREEPSSCRDG